MRGKWNYWIRQLHTWLGVFFSPLLLLFIITGWWQSVTSDEEKEAEGGFFHTLMGKLSTVHTDDHFPKPGAGGQSHLAFKVLVVAMCIALLVSIAIGLVLAFQGKRKVPMIAALILGIVVPSLLLYFA